MVKSLIVIPTYNERETVQMMADAILSLNQGFTILFVDDNSPDKTADIVDSLNFSWA